MSVPTSRLPYCALGMVLLSLFLCAPAHADSVAAWQKRTTDKGCFVYQYEESYNGMESNPSPDGYVWSGPCTLGQPISDRGTLYEQVFYVDSKGMPVRYINSMTGQLVKGFFEGRVRHQRHDVDASGRWDPHSGHVDPEFEFSTYRGGCDVEGLADQYSDYSYCTPGRAEDPIVIPRVVQPYYPLPVSLADTVDTPTFPPAQVTQPVPTALDGGDSDAATPMPASPLPPANTPRLGPAQTEQDRLWAQLPTRRTAPAAGVGMLADSTDPTKRAQRQHQVAEHQVRQAQQRREREQQRGSGTGGALLGALLQTAATVAIVKHNPDATWALNSLAQSSNADEVNQRLMAGAVTALAGGDAQQVNQALSITGYPAQLSQDEASQRLMAGTITALAGGNTTQISQALAGQSFDATHQTKATEASAFSPTSTSRVSASDLEFRLPSHKGCIQHERLPNAVGQSFVQITNNCSMDLILAFRFHVDSSYLNYVPQRNFGLHAGEKIRYQVGVSQDNWQAELVFACTTRDFETIQRGRKVAYTGWAEEKGCWGYYQGPSPGTAR